jgi:UDP-N-acetylglucosamine--N-acetylmuramyl-(pentapeptide) pyrophosphoryl-undecaprenol N-acetylglucosamine transferase
MRKIILSGGGTLGPVVPLLAVAEMYKAEAPDTVFVWVGTSRGPERSLVEEAHIPFIALSAGKWRRYFSLLNITDTFKILVAFFHSLIILTKEKPSADSAR